MAKGSFHWRNVKHAPLILLTLFATISGILEIVSFRRSFFLYYYLAHL